jgi:hypothetical protein
MFWLDGSPTCAYGFVATTDAPLSNFLQPHTLISHINPGATSSNFVSAIRAVNIISNASTITYD